MKTTLTSRQQEIVLLAVKLIYGDTDKMPTDKDKAILFINHIFGSKLESAFAIAGFPFSSINEVYRELTGKDHRTFEYLFGKSFIGCPMAGTYDESKEKPGEAVDFRAHRIQMSCFPGKVFASIIGCSA